MKALHLRLQSAPRYHAAPMQTGIAVRRWRLSQFQHGRLYHSFSHDFRWAACIPPESVSQPVAKIHQAVLSSGAQAHRFPIAPHTLSTRRSSFGAVSKTVSEEFTVSASSRYWVIVIQLRFYTISPAFMILRVHRDGIPSSQCCVNLHARNSLDHSRSHEVTPSSRYWVILIQLCSHTISRAFMILRVH
jgi:hypothetical protein